MAESPSLSVKSQKKKRSSSYVSPVKKTIASWNPMNSLPSVHKMRSNHSSPKTSPEPERQSNLAADELLANFKKSFLKEPGVVIGLSECKPFLRGASLLKITEWILFQADETISDNADAKTLFLTYRQFATPMGLFNHLTELANFYCGKQIIQGSVGSIFQTKIRKKIFFFLREWVDKWFQDFWESKSGGLSLQTVITFLGSSFPMEDVNHFKLLFVKSKQRKIRRDNLTTATAPASPTPTISIKTTDDIELSTLNIKDTVDKTKNFGTLSPGRGSPLMDKLPSSPPSDSPIFTRQASATFSSSHTVSRTTGSQIKSFLSSSPELLIIPPLPLPNPASLSASSLSSPALPSSPKGSPRFTTYFLDLKSRQIAEQMTLLEEELMFRVQRPEFLYFGKEKEKYAPNLSNLAERFNQVSRWVVTCIMIAKDTKEQILLVEKFIKIAKRLYEMNNYNSLMQIMSGLNNIAIQRLKQIREGLHADTVEILEKLEEFISPKHNFKNYRSAEKPPLHLPYLALTLRDLTFINDGNTDYLPNPLESDSVQLINFEKLKMYSDIIYSVALSDITEEGQVAYAKIYQLHPQLRAFLQNLTFYDEDTLYEYSLKHSELYHAISIPPLSTTSIPINAPTQNPPSPSENIYANMTTWNNPIYMATLPPSFTRRRKKKNSSKIRNTQASPTLQSEISMSLSNFGSTFSKATKSIIPAFSTAFTRQISVTSLQSLSPVPLSDNVSSDLLTETDSARSCDDFNSITSSDDISQPSTISESETPPIQIADQSLARILPVITINISEDVSNNNVADTQSQIDHQDTKSPTSVEPDGSQILQCLADSSDLSSTQVTICVD